MSRTTYGYIAFRIPAKDMPDEDIVLVHKRCVKEMVDVLNQYGGELCTLQDVASRAEQIKEHPEDALEHKTVKEVTEE